MEKNYLDPNPSLQMFPVNFSTKLAEKNLRSKKKEKFLPSPSKNKQKRAKLLFFCTKTIFLQNSSASGVAVGQVPQPFGFSL